MHTCVLLSSPAGPYVQHLPIRPLDRKGEVIRLETLIEFKFLNSSFSSLSSY